MYVADIIERIPDLHFHGFLDDAPSPSAASCGDYEVLGPLTAWKSLPQQCLFISSLYSPKKLPTFYQLVQSLGIPRPRWAMIIDPHAVVSRHAALEPGCVVGPGCVIEPRAKLSWGSAILGNVYVGHDTVLSEYVACANSVSLAGGITAGSAAYIGANASVREYLTVGSAAIVGMGAVVCRNVLDDEIVVGNPARPLRVT
jgi:sugar O-acyltransferase (sialic acid O-acetyltransferase NeuD family)